MKSKPKLRAKILFGVLAALFLLLLIRMTDMVLLRPDFYRSRIDEAFASSQGGADEPKNAE